MYRLLRQIAKTGIITEPAPQPDESLRQLEQRMGEAILKHFGRSLAIRHVDAGSCNGCELEIHAANSAYYNLERLGIKFVPKLVVAIGDCGCSGGIFGENYASCGAVSNVIPVDVAVPGCPPDPVAIMRGILTAVTASAKGR